jgi:hypothetical protein
VQHMLQLATANKTHGRTGEYLPFGSPRLYVLSFIELGTVACSSRVHAQSGCVDDAAGPRTALKQLFHPLIAHPGL